MTGPAVEPWVAARPGGVGAVVAWQAADGSRRVAASGNDGLLQVWDADTGESIVVPEFSEPVHESVLKLVAWRGTRGVRLAATGGGLIRIWDPETGKLVDRPLAGHTHWVSGLTAWVTPAGSDRLASGGTDGAVRVWEPEAGRLVCGPLTDHDGAVQDVTSWVLPGGSARLASVDATGTIRVWDPDTGDLIRTIRTVQAHGLGSLASWVDPGGAVRLAFGAADGVVAILDPDSGAVAAQLSGHRTWVHSLVVWVNADGQTRLASASMDGTVRIWDPQTAVAVTGPLRGGQAAGTEGGLAVWEGSDGRWRIASTGEDAVRIWDAETGVPTAELPARQVAGLWALTSWTSPDGHARLATAGDGAMVRVWDAETGASVGEPLAGHTSTVWEMVSWRDAAGHARLASCGDDGLICRWDADLVGAVGAPIEGHAGWTPAMAAWHGPDGEPRLVSGGADARVCVWDPDTGAAVARLDTGDLHCTWILTLAAWTTVDGGTRIAFAGNNPNVFVWNPDGGVEVLPTGNIDWVRSLTTWVGADGQRWLAAGGVDGTIRVLDLETGTAREPVNAHTGWVRSLVSWVDPQGRTMLASAGANDATIRIWDAQSMAAIGSPLTGHDRCVWTVTTWTGSDGQVRLASTGSDGTIRLWDPRSGRAVRTIEVGPIRMWSLSDVAATEDVLERRGLADAIADQLDGTSRTTPGEGPLVVSVEGPWGSGKSTLMNLVRDRLSRQQRPSSAGRDARRPLTVRSALASIRRYPAPDSEPAPAGEVPGARGAVTVWFNPWVHQSGEQVWAGLAYEIVEGVSPALYPTEGARQRYWFTRNLARTDRYALRRTLRRQVVSPLLGVALAAVVIQAAIALIQLNKPFALLGHTITPGAAALAVSALFVLAGFAHTAIRYVWSPAIHHLPAGLLHGPVTDSPANDGDAAAESTGDPLRRARAGALYLYQHDIAEIVTDVGALGYDLVVFIDDLDRCRPATAVEVFEAVNLFLSGVVSRAGLRTHFVIGLDPQVVAGYLDQVYEAAEPTEPVPHGDDPSTGWAFLRKLIQLPVIVPQAPDGSIERFVDRVTGTAGTQQPRPRPLAQAATPVAVAPPRLPAEVRPARVAEPTPASRGPVETIPWRTLEQHPDVRATLVGRLLAQPDRSLREAKRLINVWQLYVRLADQREPVTPTAAIRRAKQLVILAEIVTRWPALQPPLHRPVKDRRGLQILADCAADDAAWEEAVRRLDIDPARHRKALDNLRTLLKDHDARAVADLAHSLL